VKVVVFIPSYWLKCIIIGHFSNMIHDLKSHPWKGQPTFVENFDPTLAIASIFHNLWLKKLQKIKIKIKPSTKKFNTKGFNTCKNIKKLIK